MPISGSVGARIGSVAVSRKAGSGGGAPGPNPFTLTIAGDAVTIGGATLENTNV